MPDRLLERCASHHFAGSNVAGPPLPGESVRDAPGSGVWTTFRRDGMWLGHRPLER